MSDLVVKYSCAACGLHRVETRVPARGEERVVVWMDQTIRLLMIDHQRRSFGCPATQFQEVMIPYHQAKGRVGDPIVN